MAKYLRFSLNCLLLAFDLFHMASKRETSQGYALSVPDWNKPGGLDSVPFLMSPKFPNPDYVVLYPRIHYLKFAMPHILTCLQCAGPGAHKQHGKHSNRLGTHSLENWSEIPQHCATSAPVRSKLICVVAPNVVLNGLSQLFSGTKQGLPLICRCW